MGVSTDAILAYGIDLGVDWEDKVPWDYGLGLDRWLYGKLGIGYDTDATNEDRDQARVNFPVEDIYHCSDEFPMLFLAVSGTKLRASRGYPKMLEELGEPLDTAKVEAFVDQLKEWDIEWEVMGWHLFSMWA